MQEGLKIPAFPRIRTGVFAFALLLLGAQAFWVDKAAAGPCDPPANAIVCENSKPGSPKGEWDVQGSGDPSIQGFATDISVNHGETVHFKIDTASTAYRLDIYRMGYYDGDGARKVATVQPSASLPQHQPACKTQASSGLIDCGNWAESASWAVPANAVSGIYFAKLVREDQSSDGSQIVFIVRDDESHSDLLFQTSDTTWQAYNRYGGNSLYEGGPGTNPGRAYKVSYNRPLETRGPSPEDAPFSAEYPMVRWLERNGYDVSYFSGVDTDRRGSEILNHKAFLSVGHDEYWSGQQRENVEAARDAGVNLAFFSGNEIFWKTRWEDSIDGSGADHRTLVCYKETHANAKIDPESNVWTGTWRDPRFSPPADGGKPENQLSGTIFTVNTGTSAIQVPAALGKLRLWRNTSVASLAPGETATLAPETLGYEWDEDVDNGFRPAGLADLSSTTVDVPQRILDYGSNYGPGSATHHLTLYRAPSGALVFGAGTVQWSWGLDPNHDREGGPENGDPRMQQATVNLLADMGAQPQALQEDLAPATETTDTTPPTTTISSPAEGVKLESSTPITVSGIATDAEGETGGGRVAGVEVSTDGGSRWHPATGLNEWTYKWTPGKTGSTTLMARAVDDSGNLEENGDQATVEVIPHTCPCTIWDNSVSGPEDSDTSALEVGTKFRVDTSGYITGLRFYKPPGDTGTHIGYLWTGTGTRLAEATFSNETASGWQEINLDVPVQVKANTTYVASYYAPNGHYAAISNYFDLIGVDSSPLHALAAGVDGPNGIYKRGAPGELFEGNEPDSFQSASYLVDVVFAKEVAPDTTPPQVSVKSPVSGALEVDPTAAISAKFNEAMKPASFSNSSFEVRDEASEQLVGALSYNPGERKVELVPSDPLLHSTTYTVTVKGGAGGVKDLAGNALPADVSWSFTTNPAPPPPPDEGPGGPILVISNSSNPFSRYYAEILRAEGLNEFTASDISNVTPAVLADHDVAILGEGNVSAAQASMLSSWVEAGGNLIAMRPSQKLAGLLGLSSAGGTLSNAYLKVETGTAPGAGIVGQTMQFHGTADRYTASGAQTIATLFPNAGGPATANPAVTLRSVGSNGGQAAAFSYDLAKSVVYTRQGNRAWAGQERDGSGPIRPDDLFFGAKAGDEEADWVDLGKVQIPQADEQQRLLTNLIERMNADRKPLPRFWFLPRDNKAAVVMTGDDHGVGGTAGRFEKYEDDSAPGCVVAKWECVRATSYVFPETPIGNSEAAKFNAAGFEISLQAFTNCANWSSQAQLESLYSNQLATFAANFPSLPPPATERTHCIAWSDWASQPKVEAENGIRLDTNYYYWPGSWVQDQPGMFTGSGMPMRFADSDGSMIDVYQAPTQLTDESGQTYPATINTLLDNALGAPGYYGVFTADMHNDEVASEGADAIIASAQARGVPVVSARQMLTWLDGRNQSSFGSLNWNGSHLSFTISPGEGADGLRAMLPVTSPTGSLSAIVREGSQVATVTKEVKGVEYAFFDASAGSYTAVYGSELTNTVPPSPANQNSPKVVGAAPEGSTVRIYATSDCSGSPIATGTAAQFEAGIAVSVADNTTTQFRITVTPSGGSPTACSSPITYVEDSAAPQTQIDANPAAATTSTTAEFKFSGSDTGGAGVASFECRRDGGAFAACTSPKSYAALADGIHSFEVRAVDQAGNADVSPATFNWTIDTTAPTVTVDSLSKSLLAAGQSTEVHWHANENGAFELRVGGSGCASGTVLDSGAYGAQPAQHTSTVAASSLAEGANTLRVCVTDGLSNRGATTTTVSKDTTAPTTAITSSPTALSASAAASFSFSGADTGGSGIASFECRRDGEAFAPCASPKAYAGLLDGAHSFEVKAIDQAGNADPSPATFNWSIDATEPQTQLDAHPAALSTSASAEFKFSGGDAGGSGIASFECRRDSSQASDWTPCASPKSYAGLSDGSHSFEVRAIDQAGNADASPATFTWSIDTTAPITTIDSSPAALTVSPSADFSFSGTDSGGSGVASFECRRDGGAFAPCSSPISYTALADGSHSFAVRAVDQAGNPDASPATFTWNVDATAPTTTIDSGPAALATSGVAEFKFSGSDAGGSGVASFECRLDGGAFLACASPKSYSGLSDGSHSLAVRAVDQAGNVDASPAILAWTVDTTAPQTQIDSNPGTLSAASAASFSFSGTDSGGSGVSSFECRLDGGPFAPCTSPKSYTGLGEGSHTFEVKAVDQAGNLDASPASFAWTVDTTAPTTTIDSSPAALSPSAAAEFKFSGSDTVGAGVASFECRRDGGAFAACTSPKSYAGLADGNHSFEVRAIDQAGNADASPATFTWNIDATAPQTQVDSSPAALSSSSAAEFKFSGTDAGGSGVASIECRRDGEAFALCTSPVSYVSLSDGAHSFEVRAVDQAGNTDASSATFNWTVDTTAPLTQIDSSPAALSSSASADFSFSGTDSGGSGVASFECRRDGGAFAPCSSPKSYAALADGSHAFEVRAVDQAGNTDASPTTFNWTIDTTAPSTTIDSGPPTLAASASAEFKFSGADISGSGVASFECRRDGEAWAGCTSPKTYAGLSDGSHSFEVKAVDVAGNGDASPATFAWTIDTTAPTVTIDSGPSGLTNNATPTFEFHSDEPGSAFECSIDTGTPDYGPCSGDGSHTGGAPLADGPHTFRVRGTDTAGNQGVASQEFTLDTAAPPAPTLSATTPASPANENSPKVIGSAPTGSTVRLYTTADCSGTPLATASADQLAEGIAVSVGDNSTTKFRATSTSLVGNPSACSSPIAYVEDSSSPETQIGGHPASLTGSDIATFVFSGADPAGSGVASFQCRIDSNQAIDWAPCASPKSYVGLSNGAHGFEVRAIDQAGNVDGSPANFAWSIDATAPTTEIDSSPSTLAASASAEFKFSGSDTGGAGVASFECRRDGESFAPCASPKSYAALADGPHGFEVRAVDQAGNADASPATFSWRIDTTAPTVTIDSLSKSLLAAGQSTEVHWHANENGAFELRVGGSDCASGTVLDSGAYGAQPAPHTSTVAAGSLAEGANTLRVCVTDATSNRGATAGAVSKDTFEPTTAIDANPPALSSSGTAEFAFSGADTGGSGVVAFECRRDGEAFAPCTSPKAYTGLSDGSHTFEVKAVDQAGNADASSATFAWTVDTAAPDTQIESNPAALTTDTGAEFTFSGSDIGGSGIASFECRRDSSQASDWAPCTSAASYAGLADGSHSFAVRALDQAGNADASPATFAWTVDTAAPQTQIDAHPGTLTSDNAAAFTFSGDDGPGSGVGSFECRRDSSEPSGWGACSSPKSYAGLADGAHSFEVRAVDQLGNVDATPATFGWSIDTAAPAAPTLSGFAPASPANQNSPKIAGSAADGSTVRLYSGAGCGGAPVATGSAAALAAGIALTVLDNSTSSFSATATSAANNTSACSAPISYIEDSAAPQTQIDIAPTALSSSPAATFAFSGQDSGGAGVASYECRLDSTSAGAWQPCASPRAYSGLTDGAHSFEVRAIDQAGNTDSSPAGASWTIDTSVPKTPAQEPPGQGSNPSSPPASVLLEGVQYDKRKGTALLTFKVSGPGKLSASRPEEPKPTKLRSKRAEKAARPRSNAPQIRATSVNATAAGPVKLRIKLSPTGQQLLLENRKVKVRALITFEPIGQPTITQTLTITLKHSVKPRTP